MTHPPVISTEDLRKQYGETVAVDGLDLEVGTGSIYGFLGPNGAGKTTTMRVLTGLARPTAGTGTVAGISITDRERLRPHIGLLPETPPLYPELSAREQLSFVARCRSLQDAEERIEDYLDRFDLTEAADRLIDTYSTGMQQKVSLIQAVLHDPEVLFLDEPTGGLDPRSSREVRDLVMELADQDVTVMLSTHILPVVEELADHVGILHEGRLVAQGDIDSIRDRAQHETGLEEAFLELTEDQR